jgi:hypothetical protein
LFLLFSSSPNNENASFLNVSVIIISYFTYCTL